MTYAKTRYKSKFAPKYAAGGSLNSTQKATNQGISAIPVVGQFIGAGQGLSNMAQSGIKRDSTGYATTSVGKTAQEWLSPFHQDAINSFKDGDIAGGLRDITGTGTLIRGISKGLGKDQETSGFWGKTNKRSGIAKENTQHAAAIQAQSDAKAAADAEAAAIQAAEDKRKANEQDMYNKAYYASTSTTGNPTGGLYAKYGGTIHIKPSHKGRFTAYKARTGKTTEEALHSSDPHVRKMANFAKNAAKWKHGDGGKLPESGIKNGVKYDDTIIFNSKGDKLLNLDISESKNRHIDNQNKEYYRHLSEPKVTEGDYLKYKKSIGKIPYGTEMASGGTLNPLASDTVKVEGDSHEQGGVKLSSGGKPFAEVEGDEIIKGNNVYSDRIKLPNGKTIAMEAEKLAKIKGKFEKKLKSPNHKDYNTSARTIEAADRKLDALFNIQENTKNDDSPSKFDLGGAMNTVAAVAPYIDNIYAASQIDKTPAVPKPATRNFYAAKAMPMKTTYDVSTNLSDVNNSLSDFNRGVDMNTSNSTTANANKAYGFAKALNAKSAIYNTKNNVETSLINANNKNIQDTYNFNQSGKQSVDNLNMSLLDQYNWNNMLRSNDISRAKVANMSNAVEDFQTQYGDYNSNRIDKEAMKLDDARYVSGAGARRRMKYGIGTKKAKQTFNAGADEVNTPNNVG